MLKGGALWHRKRQAIRLPAVFIYLIKGRFRRKIILLDMVM